MQVHYKNFGSKTAIRCGFHSGQYNFPTHIHQFPEIVYVKEGTLEVTIDDKKELMKAGDFAIIAPFRIHSFFTPETVTRWVCVFSGDFISSFITHDELFGIGERSIFSASKGLIAFAEEHMIDSQETFLPLSEDMIRSFKAIIFAIYDEYLRKVPRVGRKNYHQALSSILFYISEHYTEDISLASIGAALNYSPKYVSLCLSEIEEMNLNHLVNSFRADHAKNLLTSTKFKMIDIALECGYANERSFYRAFSRVTGMTPGEYRKSKRTFATQENEENYYPILYEQKAERKRKDKITSNA